MFQFNGVFDKIDKPLEYKVSDKLNVKGGKSFRNQLMVTDKKTQAYKDDLLKCKSLEITGKFHGSCCLVAIFTEELCNQMIQDNTIKRINTNKYSYDIKVKKKNVPIILEIGVK